MDQNIFALWWQILTSIINIIFNTCTDLLLKSKIPSVKAYTYVGYTRHVWSNLFAKLCVCADVFGYCHEVLVKRIENKLVNCPCQLPRVHVDWLIRWRSGFLSQSCETSSVISHSRKPPPLVWTFTHPRSVAFLNNYNLKFPFVILVYLNLHLSPDLHLFTQFSLFYPWIALMNWITWKWTFCYLLTLMSFLTVWLKNCSSHSFRLVKLL